MEQGVVTSVEYEDGVVYCGVRASRLNNEYEEVPVLKPVSGFVQVPRQGERVTLQTLKGGNKRFISHVMSKEEANPDSMKSGELTVQLDAGTFLQFQKSESAYDLNISSSGEMNIEASGDVNIDSGGGVFINGIEFSTHTHDYSWTDGGGSDTTSGPS